MPLRDFLPIFKPSTEEKSAKPLPADDQDALMKSFKVSAIPLGTPGYPTSITERGNFESAPYNFNRIIQAVETDSYVQQAFNKYGELFWKEGWDIVGENHEAVDYLWQRIDFIEVAMNRPFQDFLSEVSDQLFKFHNVFIVKVRGDLAPMFPTRLHPPEDEEPIIGYYVLPTEQIEILRDRNNKPKAYRQNPTNSEESFINTTRKTLPTWKSVEVIHLHRKKKPGRAFGCPFITPALDDVIALRQMEEDAQNLSHREMYPLYKYQIGTDEHPASPQEIEAAQVELDNLRSEGGLVMPHRHNVEVVGAEGKALDISAYLDHFKKRLAIGMGLFPHQLGMEAGGNRAATDRLDIALYDRIKEYQTFFSDAVRFFIFNDLLLEGNYDPFVSPQLTGISDRCEFRFNEIDTDTQVKKDANTISKVTSGLEQIDEGRMDLKRHPVMDESKTLMAMQARMTPDQTVQTKRADGTPGQPKLVDTTPAAAKDNTTPSSTGGKPNMRNLKKGAGNVIRPQNQFGTRTSPNIRHNLDVDIDFLNEMVSLLDEENIKE